MSETLYCLSNGELVGELIETDGKIYFYYVESWIKKEDAHPISLRMPVSRIAWKGKGMQNFLWGLLPDDPVLLRRWGTRYGVSHKNPFQLLKHRGEDCAGDIQFLPERQYHLLKDESIDHIPRYLEEKDVHKSLFELIESIGTPRHGGSEDNTGRFSLPGAQPKLALHFSSPQPGWFDSSKVHLDPDKKLWFQSSPKYPTTHILKPQRPEYEDFAINEHFCLELARAIGMPAAETFVLTGGKVLTIVVKRYDRKKVGDVWLRVHQEDICQSLGVHPDFKYQSDGGPSAHDIIKHLDDVSSMPEDDIRRFIDALIFNWIIGGSDGHAKNYSLLIGKRGNCRLARLYDIASALPYPRQHPIQKLRLAMKIGSEYRISRINRHQWEKFMSPMPSRYKVGMYSITGMIQDVKEQVRSVADAIRSSGIKSPIIDQLETCIMERVLKLEVSMQARDN